MSSSNSDSDRPPTDGDVATNPFVAFRHFADSQMTSLFDNVFGIFQSSPIRRQQMIDDFESKLKQPDEMERRIENAHKKIYLYVRENLTAEEEGRQTRADSERNLLPVVRGLRLVGRPPQKLGLLDEMLRPSGLDAGYIFMSPYSPLALEKQEIFRDQTGKMRAAFADLMALQAGEGLLPDSSIEEQAEPDPLRWAANMAKITALGRSRVWEGMSDRENSDGNPKRWHFSRLPSKFRRLDEEPTTQAELWEDDSRAQYEDKDTIPELSIACEALRLALFGNNENEEKPSRDEETVTLEAQDKVLIAEPESKDEQPEANNKSGCACIHCRFYDRRREEFLQWRKEENEAEADAAEYANDNIDDERTTNPTSELDQYHTLADYQAQVLKLEQQNKPKPEILATEAAPREANSISKPSILSTLTTTEQRTLPDGTVTTKVVLKKRFSDGGEEVTERVHTQNPPSSPEEPTMAKATTPKSQISILDAVGKEKQKQESKNQEGKRGWFWS